MVNGIHNQFPDINYSKPTFRHHHDTIIKTSLQIMLPKISIGTKEPKQQKLEA